MRLSGVTRKNAERINIPVCSELEYLFNSNAIIFRSYTINVKDTYLVTHF